MYLHNQWLLVLRSSRINNYVLTEDITTSGVLIDMYRGRGLTALQENIHSQAVNKAK